MNRAVFIDKDGTLVKNVPYNVDPQKVQLVKTAAEAIAKFHGLGYKIIIVTNQSGVARGLFSEEDVETIGKTLRRIVKMKSQVDIDGFFYCPHHPEGVVSQYAIDCDCRKPRPGMLIRAACEMEVDLAKSWMIGDILDDIEAGNLAGCRTIMVDCGNETEWVVSENRVPTYMAQDLIEAVEYIEAEENNDIIGGKGDRSLQVYGSGK
ncbi:MAG TPA: HAD family hydrolase [Anaerolineaceae bacterium]|nr:HAD family hydrolase [Anaerolineaceae bacterium]